MSESAKRNRSAKIKVTHCFVDKLEIVAIANALQLEGRPTAGQSIWATFGQICTAHEHKLLTVSFG